MEQDNKDNALRAVPSTRAGGNSTKKKRKTRRSNESILELALRMQVEESWSALGDPVSPQLVDKKNKRKNLQSTTAS